MEKKYSLQSILLNRISVIIGIVCVVLSVLENRFLVVSIILLVMTLLELIINIINYIKLRSK